MRLAVTERKSDWLIQSMPGIQGRVSAAEGTAAPHMVGVGCLGFAPFSDFFVLIALLWINHYLTS